MVDKEMMDMDELKAVANVLFNIKEA